MYQACEQFHLAPGIVFNDHDLQHHGNFSSPSSEPAAIHVLVLADRVSTSAHKMSNITAPPSTLSTVQELMPPRPAVPAAESMAFWDRVLPQAMNELNSKEPPRISPEYDIRSKTNWVEIHAQLQKARANYDGDKRDFFGRMKIGLRRVLDQSDKVARVAKIVKDVEYVSMVMAAVEVLLDAAKTATQTRETIKSGLDPDELERNFAIIEIFLSTFRDDENILRAAIELVVCILAAVEQGIVFFWKSQLRRAGSAIAKGEDYQRPLIEQLDQIKTSSDRLIREAELSHVVGTRDAMRRLLEASVRMEQSQREDLRAIKTELESLMACWKTGNELGAELLNLVKRMLEEADKERRDRDQQTAMQQETIERLERLAIQQNLFLRTLTPSPNHYISSLPGTYTMSLPPSSPSGHSSNPAVLLMNHSPSPSQQIHQPSPWPTLPATPQAHMQTQPQQYGHQHQHQYMHPPNYQYQYQQNYHQQPAPYQQPQYQTPMLTVAYLIQCLRLPTQVDEADLHRILSSSGVISAHHRARAYQAGQSDQFRRWLDAGTSSQRLLIVGDFERHPPLYTSAFSSLCAALIKGMRDRLSLQVQAQAQAQAQPPQEIYIPLIWFCGLHVDSEDEEKFPSDTPTHQTIPFSAPVTMLRSFIAQLLRYYPHLNLLHLEHEVDLTTALAAAREGKLKALWKLFRCLVRRLPGSVTLVCVVDGVVHYEINRYEEEIMGGLGALLKLGKEARSGQGVEQCRVKVLVVSPTETESVHGLFEEGEGGDACSVLSLAGEPVGMGGFEMGGDGGDSWVDGLWEDR